MNCPECGALNKACESRFNEFLAKEFTDPGYGAVHHLTVAAYMLQHSSKLAQEGWLYERNLLREFLIQDTPPSLVRMRNKDVVDANKRKFNITSRNGMPLFEKSKWTKTIMDVNTDEAEIYCRDVVTWARAVLEDASSLLRED